MSPSAQRLHNAFARLAGEPHGLLYFSEFFRDGYDAWPEWMRKRYPALASWRGVNGLSRSFQRYVGASPDSNVLFASRSTSLMRLAAWELATRCDQVLTVDFLWPPYRKILMQVCRQAGAQLRVVRLREQIFRHHVSPQWIAELVCDAASRSGARGVFLPAITHRGIQLPIEAIIDRLRSEHHLEMTIVDAAQAIGHTPLKSLIHECDFVLAGTHKWLGSGQPLGIGIGSCERWTARVTEALRRRRVDDPILKLCCESSGQLSIRHGETASLVPLLSSQGALDDVLQENARDQLATRLGNRRRLAKLLRRSGWREMGPREVTSNGILLAKPPTSKNRRSHLAMREAMLKYQILATIYRDNVVRFSLPVRPFTKEEFDSLVHTIA